MCRTTGYAQIVQYRLAQDWRAREGPVGIQPSQEACPLSCKVRKGLIHLGPFLVRADSKGIDPGPLYCAARFRIPVVLCRIHVSLEFPVYSTVLFPVQYRHQRGERSMSRSAGFTKHMHLCFLAASPAGLPFWESLS